MISPLRFGRRRCSRWAGLRQPGMPALFLETRSAIRNRRSVTRLLLASLHADDFGWGGAGRHRRRSRTVSEGRRYVMRSCLGLVALIVTTASLFACGSSPVTPPDPALPGTKIPGPETTQLLAALQRNGATADIAEIMSLSSMPFFSVPAVRVLVNAASVHVFEYATVSAADAEAARFPRTAARSEQPRFPGSRRRTSFAGIGSLCCT